jgi:hypothetical protein
MVGNKMSIKMSKIIKVSELQHGDQVELEDGELAVVQTVKKFPLIETAGDTTYEVAYTVKGEEGSTITGGKSKVSVLT